MIARTLAGMTESQRPLFLKMAYHGPRALEELINYDPHLIVGMLGGSAGTTHDAFHMQSEELRRVAGDYRSALLALRDGKLDVSQALHQDSLNAALNAQKAG